MNPILPEPKECHGSAVLSCSVAIVIPTFNSAATLDQCLASVAAQSLPPNEVIVVDGGSTDSTLAIAQAHGATLMSASPPGLLNSRRLGAITAKSVSIAMIDSDQVLERFALNAAIDALRESDMVILGEYSIRPSTWLERLFAADRLRLQAEWRNFSDPQDGVLLPRVFKASVLQQAFANISRDAIESVVANDHNIIFHEAWKATHRLGYVPNAVGHHEVATIGKLFKKQFRWGVHESKSSRRLGRDSDYQRLWNAKLRFRLHPRGLLADPAGWASLALLLLKGGPYCAGYVWQRLVGGDG
jgi:glycosyltransferase involved in cell wall biosynthesis